MKEEKPFNGSLAFGILSYFILASSGRATNLDPNFGTKTIVGKSSGDIVHLVVHRQS